MSETRVLVLLVLCFVCVKCAVLSGKAFYCRDPESGKLHAVNTTWPASSFCGNYTCKIRRRNVTETEIAPLRQLNVTNVRDQNADINKTITIEKKIEPDIMPILHKNRVPDANDNLIKPNVPKLQPKTFEPSEEKPEPIVRNCTIGNEHLKIHDKEGDRYLTEKEIANIAEILHTVKKSDLDAIVDIYNLAQDIYKELDKATDTDIVRDAINLIKDDDKHKGHGMKPTSYWYDPLSNKGRMADRYYMDVQNTRIVHSTMKPKTNVPTYFNGILSSNDFGKVPYYYPITQFQRTSSYTKPSYKPSDFGRKDSIEVVKKKPCKTKSNQNTQPRSKTQKLIQPSHLLPYPFASIHQYNISDYPSNFYYSGNPWTLDYYNKFKYYQPYFNAYISPVSAVPNAILVNPHLSNEVQDIEQKPVKTVNDKELLDTLLGKGKNIPKWKTEPITIEVLKDIRANIDTSRLIKAFPLRKKVKLERVGKLINTDELNSLTQRGKRSIGIERPKEEIVGDFGEYETYLERVTCNDETEPGYFRIGNLTQPYPGCCPQLIHTR